MQFGRFRTRNDRHVSAVYVVRIAMVLLLLCADLPALTQSSVMKLRITSFQVNHESRINAVLQLAHQEGIPLGIEYAGEQLFAPVTFHLGAADVQQVVKKLFPSHDGFRIFNNNGVIIISHRNVPGQKSNILGITLIKFSIPRCSLQEAFIDLADQIQSQLMPPFGKRGIMGSIPGEGSTQIGPLMMTDVTVKEALNRIVWEAGEAAWIVQVEPSGLRLPRGADLMRRVEDGTLVSWTVVEYNDDAVMKSIAKITREHAIKTKPASQ